MPYGSFKLRSLRNSAGVKPCLSLMIEWKAVYRIVVMVNLSGPGQMLIAHPIRNRSSLFLHLLCFGLP